MKKNKNFLLGLEERLTYINNSRRMFGEEERVDVV